MSGTPVVLTSVVRHPGPRPPLESASELVERFRRIVRDSPDRLVVHACSEARSLSAALVWQETRQAADTLARQGLGPGHLVISVAGNRSGFLSVLLACLAQRIVVMPVDRGTTMLEALALADRFGAAALVLACEAGDAAAGLPRPCRTTPLPGGLALAVFDGAMPQPASCHAAALLKVTSGSAGLPKATIATERHLVLDSEHIIEAFGIRTADTQLGLIPLSHAYGLSVLVVPLFLLGTAFVLRESFVPAQVREDAERFGARLFPGVPFMFDHLAGTLPADAWPRSLRTLVSAGARLDAAMARDFTSRFGVKIHSFYGTTETGGISYDSSDDLDTELSVGWPLPGVTVTTRPDASAPPGAGRVHVAGEVVTTGYAESSDGEAHSFVDGGFLTGDLGRIAGDGRLHLVGRVSAFVNVAGRKVQPDEVERVLCEMPGIVDARVVGVDDPRRGQQLVACLVVEGNRVSPFAIRQFCAPRLSPHKIPRAFVFLDDLPRDSRGKTTRRALESLVAERLRTASARRDRVL